MFGLVKLANEWEGYYEQDPELRRLHQEDTNALQAYVDANDAASGPRKKESIKGGLIGGGVGGLAGAGLGAALTRNPNVAIQGGLAGLIGGVPIGSGIAVDRFNEKSPLAAQERDAQEKSIAAQHDHMNRWLYNEAKGNESL